MLALLTRLRSARRRRFDSRTGRRRRGGIALAGGIVLALLVGSGFAVAAATSVSAHTPNITHDCTGVRVLALYYSPNVVNTVTVTIYGGNPDGSDEVQTRTFGSDFDERFLFPDSSRSWKYSASIDAADDDGTKGWDYSWTDTSTPCSVPDIGIIASTCMHPGESAVITATISPLVSGGVYTVQLTGSNGYDSGVQPIQTTSATWTVQPGYDYTAVLTETVSGLSDTSMVHAIGCPSSPGFDVSVTQCTTPGGNGSFGVTFSNLEPGRYYTASLVNTAGGPTIDHQFMPTSSTYTDSFPTSPSGTYLVRLTDILDGTSKDSSTVTYLPCPDHPTVDISATACTVADGTSNASVTLSATGLVPGRSYSVTVTSGSTTVYSDTLAPATQSTGTKTLSGLDPGTYTVTITDTTDPAAPGYTVSASTTIKDCPTQQTITLTPQQCEVPGGAGTLTATVTDFGIGRSYIVTLTQNDLPVAGQPVSQNFDPVDATPGVFVYKGLTPGLTYRVMVEDVTGLPVALSGGGGGGQGTAGSSVGVRSAVVAGSTLPSAADDILLTNCPGNPDLTLSQPACTVFTITTITTTLDKLMPGETYTVSLTTTSDGKPVAGQPDQQFVATGPTATVAFPDLPVGRYYTVTATNSTKTLTATGKIFLSLCDLPTLAYTGASTMTPTLAGLGFLQFGLVLVGISLVRRRSGAREV